jgi:integrase
MAKPRKSYVPSYSPDPIAGLARIGSSNRWRCQDCRWQLRESDERLAVERFRQHRRNAHDDMKRVTVEMGTEIIHGTLDGVTTITTDTVPEHSLVQWCREQLLTRPEWLAEQTGIPQLARLADLPQPKESPRLDSLLPLYLDGKGHDKSQHERRKKERYYGQFVAFMANRDIQTAKQLTSDDAIAYGNHVAKTSKSTTAQRIKLEKPRTIINYALKRGLDVVSAVAALKAIDVPSIQTGKSKPISKNDFQKLLHAADDVMRASLLLSLNCCMYGSEVCKLQWDDINLEDKTFVARRGKTGIVRCAVLWDETIAALRLLPSKTPYVLPSRSGKALLANSYNRKYRALRDAVGVAAEHNQIRDGGYTAAVAAGVALDKVKLLAGHRLGIADAYLLRQPQMTADAVAAIHHAYLDD